MTPQTFLSILRDLEEAETFADLTEAFRPVQEHFGLSTFLCARLTAVSGAPREVARSTAKDVRATDGVLMSTKPGTALVAATVDADWMRLYADRRHVEYDPVLWQSLFCSKPFLWDPSFRHPALPETYQKRVLEDAADCGVMGGCIWPIHEPGMTVGIISCFAEGNGDRLRSVLSEEGDTLLNLLIQTLYRQCIALRCAKHRDTPQASLSRREKEVLHWSALGKTAWEVGRILGIAERTVNFHLVNAMRKLEVTSRPEAIAAYTTQEWGNCLLSRHTRERRYATA